MLGCVDFFWRICVQWFYFQPPKWNLRIFAIQLKKKLTKWFQLQAQKKTWNLSAKFQRHQFGTSRTYDLNYQWLVFFCSILSIFVLSFVLYFLSFITNLNALKKCFKFFVTTNLIILRYITHALKTICKWNMKLKK